MEGLIFGILQYVIGTINLRLNQYLTKFCSVEFSLFANLKGGAKRNLGFTREQIVTATCTHPSRSSFLVRQTRNVVQ